MKKEVLDKVKDVFDRFPEIDRLWVSAKGTVYLDSTREVGLTVVKRSDINNEETKEGEQ